MSEEYKTVVRAEVLEEETFLRLTLSKKLLDDDTPWIRVSIRPVLVKGQRELQFSYFDPKKDVTQNFSGNEALARLDKALDMPFGQLHVQATSGDLQVLVSRKGHVHISRSKPVRTDEAPVLAHDRLKRQPLAENDPFLRAVEIVNKRGKVRAALRPKLRQINEFLRIIDLVVPDVPDPDLKLNIVDCGCGSAYLTFAAYHHLNHSRHIPARVVGIDTNKELIEKTAELRDRLKWNGLDFRASGIIDFQPDKPPDLVLSLHACDTATDEAIAQGVRWRSRVILAAPCCQHELHHQLKTGPLQAILRHGILRERQADIVTDTFRALALRIMGYRTDVIEFISSESTSKNLMIRAELGPEPHLKPGDPEFVEEYNDLKRFLDVTPAIERMLGDEFASLLTGTAH